MKAHISLLLSVCYCCTWWIIESKLSLLIVDWKCCNVCKQHWESWRSSRFKYGLKIVRWKTVRWKISQQTSIEHKTRSSLNRVSCCLKEPRSWPKYFVNVVFPIWAKSIRSTELRNLDYGITVSLRLST